METNEKAQAVLSIVAKLTRKLHDSSVDGKLEAKEVVSALMSVLPELLALTGVPLGN